MAYTYSNTPRVSKLKIGEQTFWLKDSDVRTILDTFNNAIVTGSIGAMNEQNKFVYSQTIKAYVDSAIKVGVTVVKVNELPTATAETEGKIYIKPQNVAHTSDIFEEYITIDNSAEAETRYTWEKIGDTSIDLSNYYNKDEIDDMFDELGAMAHANTASGTVAGQTIQNITASYTPSGTISTPSIDITPTPKTISVKKTDGEVHNGSAASIAEGFVTPGQAATLTDQTKGFFAQSGVVVTVGADNTELEETLIFSDAQTAQAVTDRGTYTQGSVTQIDVTKFNGGTPTSVTLPTFENTQVVDSVSAALHEAPVFTGNAGTANVDDITISSKSVTVTPDIEE